MPNTTSNGQPLHFHTYPEGAVRTDDDDTGHHHYVGTHSVTSASYTTNGQAHTHTIGHA